MKKRRHHHDDTAELPDLLLAEDAGHAREVRRVVTIGCVVNALLMIMKLTVGWFGHSDALFADGFHSLNDVAVDLVMLVFVGISYRGANSRYAYGYGKFETFSSLLISLLMIFIAVMIGIEGVRTIVGYAHGAVLEHPDIWTIFAVIVAMGAKEGLYRFYTAAGRRIDSTALQAAGWHHRIDALSSIAVLVGVAGAYLLGEKWRVLDPCASLVIAVMILFPAVRLLIPSFNELVDAQLPAGQRRKALDAVSQTGGVAGIAQLKARRCGHCKVFDVRIYVEPGLTVEQCAVIAGNVERALVRAFCPHIYVSVQTLPKP